MSELTLSPLKMASEDELISELKSRSDACLIVRLKSRSKAELFFLDYHSLTMCVGLAERSRARLLEIALKKEPFDETDREYES